MNSPCHVSSSQEKEVILPPNFSEVVTVFPNSAKRVGMFCKTIFLNNTWNPKFYLYLPILAAWRFAAPFSLCMWRKEQQSKRDAWTRWTIRSRWQQNWPKSRDVARPRLAMLLWLLPTQVLSLNWAPIKAQQSAHHNLQSDFTVCFMT